MTWSYIKAWKERIHERMFCQEACIEAPAEVATAETHHLLLPEHDAYQEAATQQLHDQSFDVELCCISIAKYHEATKQAERLPVLQSERIRPTFPLSFAKTATR